MAQRQHSARRVSSSRRLTFLVGTAALGAIGVSVLAPSAQADDANPNRQAALILAEASTPEAAAQDTGGSADSAQGASAVAKAQARVQNIAETRTAAAASAAKASTPPPAPQQFPATSDGYRAYALSKVGASQFGCLNLLWNRESH